MSKYERGGERVKKKLLNQSQQRQTNSIDLATSWYATVIFSGMPLSSKTDNKLKVSHYIVVQAAIRFRLFFTGEPEQTGY